MARNDRFPALLLGLALLLACGCSQYRHHALGVTAASNCADFSHGCSKTVWSFAWGLAHAGSDADSCGGNAGLSEVTVRDRPDYFLLTWITLGLVAPKKLEWKCGPPCVQEGVFGAIPDSAGVH